METEKPEAEDKPHPSPSLLLNLPPELQAQIYSYLTLSDLRTLRAANRHLYSLLTVSYLRLIYTPAQLQHQLTHICGTCFWKSPPPGKLVWRSEQAMSIPLEGRCVRCGTEDGTLNPSRYLKILDLSNAGMPRSWIGVGAQQMCGVCRWCGIPTWVDGEWHRPCYKRYGLLLHVQFTTVVVRTLWTLVSMSLVLRYWSSEKIVLAPCVIAFLVLGVTFLFIFFRGKAVRTYHITGSLEAMLFILFIPTTYFLATQVNKRDDGLPNGMTMACLVMYAVNLLIRLLNVLGSIVLSREYNVVELNRQGPPYRKLLNTIKKLLVWWTFPRCMDNKYIGKQLQQEQHLDLNSTWREFKHVMFRHPSDIDY